MARRFQRLPGPPADVVPDPQLLIALNSTGTLRQLDQGDTNIIHDGDQHFPDLFQLILLLSQYLGPGRVLNGAV